MGEDALAESLKFLRESLEGIGGEVSLRTFNPSIDKFLNDEEEIKGEELEEESTLTISYEYAPTSIDLPEGKSRTVYAVDTSSVILGECGGGVVFAVRGVIVRYNPKDERSVIIRRIESPCYVNNENRRSLYNSLRRRLLGLDEVKRAPDPVKMVDRVRNIYERYLQLQASSLDEESILLFDGSLTGGTVDTPVTLLRRILSSASQNRNDVVAFSKKTKLITRWGERVLDLLEGVEDFPVIVPLKSIIHLRGNRKFLGEIYVAKLSRTPISFRVDIYSKRSHGQVMADLLCSVYLESGYPKPLIEAHVYSYFNPFDCLAYQALLAKRGVLLRHEIDVRRILFGVYGGS